MFFSVSWLTDDNQQDFNSDGIVNFVDYALLLTRVVKRQDSLIQRE